MDPDAKKPNEAQRKALGLFLYWALLELRLLTGSGQAEQARDLVDAIHNLPALMWSETFSLSRFREGFLRHYVQRWGDQREYLGRLDDVEKMGDGEGEW